MVDRGDNWLDWRVLHLAKPPACPIGCAQQATERLLVLRRCWIHTGSWSNHVKTVVILIISCRSGCIERAAQVAGGRQPLLNFEFSFLFLQVLVHSLLQKQVFPVPSHLLFLLLPLLLFNLLLQVRLHLCTLLFFLTFDYVFLVSAAKNASMLLKCNIKPSLDDLAASHDRGEVLLGQGRVGVGRSAALLIRWQVVH